MPIPEGWDPAAAVEACPVVGWEGHVWRMHNRRYPATDQGGALKVSGRYHRGKDHFPKEQVFPALYLATSPEICLGEIYRHVTPALLPALNNYGLSKLFARLATVLDCRDPTLLGLSLDDLVHDTDYETTQSIGAAAFAKEVEGILTVSATRLGDNLILFPIHLGPGSRFTLVSSREPRLYVERP